MSDAAEPCFLDYDPWELEPIRWDAPQVICKCGHDKTAHRHDLKNDVCTTSACGCLTFRPGRHRFHGHVYRTEEIA